MKPPVSLKPPGSVEKIGVNNPPPKELPREYLIEMAPPRVPLPPARLISLPRLPLLAPLSSLHNTFRSSLASLRARSLSSPSLSLHEPLREVNNIYREWTPQSKRCGALGMKCGMTQAWTVWGEQIPLTVVELQDLQVVQVKTENVEGYNALQLGGGWQKRKRLSRAMLGHFSQRSISYKRYLREFLVTKDALLPVGTSITVRHFVPGQYVDVQGVTKGKGFQGVMKRWGFAGQPASHGVTRAHRKPGSSGGAAGSMYKTGIWKGKKMPGKMGNKNRTAFCLLVYKIDPEHNLIYLKGSVPGHHGSLIRLKDTVLGQKQIMGKRGLPHPPPFPTFLPGDPLPEQLVAPQPEGDPLRLDP